MIVYRFTVRQYNRMAKLGVLTPSDRVELLEGWILDKLPPGPRLASAIELTRNALDALLPARWEIRDQRPIAVPKSRPEPAISVVRGPARRYMRQHPTPADIGLLIEVADTTLEVERGQKGRIYAQAHVPIYWIINLSEQIIEVYSRPRGGKSPAYRHRQDYGRKDAVPLVIEGREFACIPVRKILPR